MLEINKIYNADCLDLMKKIDDKSIDCIITDPPYKKVQGGCTNHAVRLKGATREDMASGKFFKENIIKFEQWLPECFRVLKDNSHCYIFIDDRNLKDILVIGEKVGFKLLNILTWKKNKHSPNRYYLKNSEFIVMFRKGKAKNINNMGTYQVLEFDSVKNKIHPSEKPYELIRCLLLNSSSKNDKILDLFMGSGVCGEVCILNNRNFIGIEKDNNYFKLAKERIDNATAQLRLF